MDDGKLSFGIEKILNHLPSLRVLSLSTSMQNDQWKDVTSFGRLKCLKKLYLNAFSTEQMERILNALREGNVQLERLRMRGFKCFEDFYGLVDELCEHKTVESVQINEINDDYLMRITQSLKHLNEFETSSTKVSMIGVRKALTEAIHMKKAMFSIGLTGNWDVDIDDLHAIQELQKTRGIDLKVIVNDTRDLSEVNERTFQYKYIMSLFYFFCCVAVNNIFFFDFSISIAKHMSTGV